MNTPGPWKFERSDSVSLNFKVLVASSRYGEGLIARVYTEDDTKLIAASPTMKSALETVLFGLTDDVTNNNGKVDFDGLIKTVKTALAKAEGI